MVVGPEAGGLVLDVALQYASDHGLLRRGSLAELAVDVELWLSAALAAAPNTTHSELRLVTKAFAFIGVEPNYDDQGAELVQPDLPSVI